MNFLKLSMTSKVKNEIEGFVTDFSIQISSRGKYKRFPNIKAILAKN